MKSVNIITKRAKRDYIGELKRDGKIDIRGELEIFGMKDGKVFHYDKADNQVTIWAKHATMHLLTNESFSSHGVQRIFDSENPEAHLQQGEVIPGSSPVANFDYGEGINIDGTLLSGEQYFSNNTSPDYNIDARWSKSTVSVDPSADVDANNSTSIEATDMMYPFAPTKMLFGTGFEWDSWQSVLDYDTANSNTVYQDEYTQDYATSTDFNLNINNADNDYSNLWSETTGDNLVQARTMNDVYSRSLTSPAITDQDWGIPGAVKNGNYVDSSTQRDITGYTASDPRTMEDVEGREILVPEWRGIGKPSFIYPTRESRFYETGTEVKLSADAEPTQYGDIENKITYQVVMPEQTGMNENIFYPYNGYTLKVAGLFCDARLLLENTLPAGAGREEDLYNIMPYGIMYAKRYISPIKKSHDVSITSRWTLFL